MTTRILDKSEWHSYFDSFGKVSLGKQLHIEIVDARLGDQVLVETSPLVGITYEPGQDMLEIALKGLDHLIEHPRKISIEEKDGVLKSFEVIDSEGRHQIVTVHPSVKM
jgi:hypothetical protein